MMYKIDHLSVSQVSTFSRCEFQWFLKYVEKLSYPINSALVRGKAIHSGLSLIYQQKKESGKFSSDDVLDAAIDLINNADGTEEVIWDTERYKIKAISVQALNQYMESDIVAKVKPYQIMQIEKKLEITIYTPDGDAIKIIGIPDLVLTDKVIDFKTKTRKPSGIDTDFKFQTAFYTTVTRKPNIEIQFLICKNNPETVIMSIESDDNIRKMSRLIFIKTYNKIKSALQSGNFLPTGIFHPWACRFCGYATGGKCPYSLSQAA
jgi:CRISPR/Cas system-associated exonuclease Cas4 (RecB family)